MNSLRLNVMSRSRNEMNEWSIWQWKEWLNWWLAKQESKQSKCKQS
jgi:hypothetical protein